MADSDRDRLRRDAAGVGPYARDAEHLVRLTDMDGWNVAEGEPDIRSWEVRTVGGRELGKVKDLLIDADAGEVVMMDVVVTGTDQHALVPLRAIEIDRRARVVRMDSSDLTASEQAPASEGKTSVERRWAESGRVRYRGVTEDERVVERRPIVEEVVVRRRAAEPERAEEARPTDEKRDQPS
jgi:hypothetical protein